MPVFPGVQGRPAVLTHLRCCHVFVLLMSQYPLLLLCISWHFLALPLRSLSARGNSIAIQCYTLPPLCVSLRYYSAAVLCNATQRHCQSYPTSTPLFRCRAPRSLAFASYSGAALRISNAVRCGTIPLLFHPQRMRFLTSPFPFSAFSCQAVPSP